MPASNYQPVNKGTALISALFIMTLAVIAATAMATRLQLDIYRTRLTILTNKLELASQLVTFWAMDALADNNNQFIKGDKKGRVLTLPKKLSTLYPDLIIKGSLYDLQARFNLNNLQNKDYIPAFKQLLGKADPALTPEQKNDIVRAGYEWIEPYSSKYSNESASFYAKQQPPYQASHQPFHDLSEFRLIKGINGQLYQSLKPYLCALPEITPINIYTALPEVLTALTNKPAQLAEILALRDQIQLLDKKTIAEKIQLLALPANQLTFSSNYFLSKAIISSGELTLITETIFKRSINAKGIEVKVISQHASSQ